MYQFLKDLKRTDLIKKILLFYLIVFVASVLYAWCNYYVDSYEYYKKNLILVNQTATLVFTISYYALLAAFEMFFITTYIDEYKKSDRSIKKIIENLLKHTFFVTMFVIITFTIMVLISLNETKYMISSIVLITIIHIAIIIIDYLSVLFFENVIIKKIDAKYIKIIILCMILLPILIFRGEILNPIKGYTKAIGVAITKNKEYLQKNKPEDIVTDEREIYSYIEYVESALDDYKVVENINDAEVGDVIKFGKSFVKNNISKKIDNYYCVLDKNEDYITLMSFYCVDLLNYDDLEYYDNEYKIVEYLNTTFYENAFSEEEKELIIEKSYNKSKEYKVYIPSLYEVSKAKDNKNIIKFLRMKIGDWNIYYNYFKENTDNPFNNSIRNYVLSPHRLQKNTVRIYSTGESRDIDRIYDRELTSSDSFFKFNIGLRPIITIKNYRG